MNVNPGELNKKIGIIKIEPGEENSNGFEVGQKRIVIRECYAKVTNVSGKELFAANTEMTEVNKRFLVRYSSKEITTDMVIEYNGKEFDIEYVSDFLDSHEYLEIWVKRRDMSGI